MIYRSLCHVCVTMVSESCLEVRFWGLLALDSPRASKTCLLAGLLTCTMSRLGSNQGLVALGRLPSAVGLGCTFWCVSLVSRAGVYTLVRFPWLCHCHAARSHAQETSQCHGRVKACSSSCSIRVGCDRVYRPCNGDTAVDATPAQSTIPWTQMGGSPCQGTRVEWTLAESVDEVGGPQCVV